MKSYCVHSILFLVFSLCIQACITEPKEVVYDVSIRNLSDQKLELRSYYFDALVKQETIESMQNGFNCTSLPDEDFIGYNEVECQLDSLVIVFPNSKGYIHRNFIGDSYAFLGAKSLVNQNFDWIKTSDNKYEFVITQEDYENAHDLP